MNVSSKREKSKDSYNSSDLGVSEDLSDMSEERVVSGESERMKGQVEQSESVESEEMETVTEWQLNDMVVSSNSLVCPGQATYAIYHPPAGPHYFPTSPNPALQQHYFPPVSTITNASEAAKIRPGSIMVNANGSHKSDIRTPFYPPQPTQFTQVYIYINIYIYIIIFDY